MEACRSQEAALAALNAASQLSVCVLRALHCWPPPVLPALIATLSLSVGASISTEINLFFLSDTPALDKVSLICVDKVAARLGVLYSPYRSRTAIGEDAGSSGEQQCAGGRARSGSQPAACCPNNLVPAATRSAATGGLEVRKGRRLCCLACFVFSLSRCFSAVIRPAIRSGRVSAADSDLTQEDLEEQLEAFMRRQAEIESGAAARKVEPGKVLGADEVSDEVRRQERRRREPVHGQLSRAMATSKPALKAACIGEGHRTWDAQQHAAPAPWIAMPAGCQAHVP